MTFEERFSREWEQMQPLIKTEADWQRVVTNYAESLGWDWMHIGRVGKHRANGAKGTLGKGWPDLFLVKGRRWLVVELKMPGESLSQQQSDVMLKMSKVAEYHVWRPADFALMAEVLHD